MQTRLERSTTNRIVGGICGGIAEYLQVDATLVRVFFVIVILLTAGFAILGYIALLFLMPMPGQPQPFVRGATGKSSATSADAAPPSDPSDPNATMPCGNTMPQPDRAEHVPEEPARPRAAAPSSDTPRGSARSSCSACRRFRLGRGDILWPLVIVVAACSSPQRVRREPSPGWVAVIPSRRVDSDRDVGSPPARLARPALAMILLMSASTRTSGGAGRSPRRREHRVVAASVALIATARVAARGRALRASLASRARLDRCARAT